MFIIELKLRGHTVATVPIDESTLRDLAYASGACTRTAGRDANTSTIGGYAVCLHRDPGADSLQVIVRERGEVKAEVHVSTESIRDLLDADHTTYIADHWPAMLEESVARIDAFRDAHPEHPIVDVQYADLVTDPVATVRSIYAAVGDELDDAAAKAITAYVEAHPRGQFGAHRYDLAEYGLDAGELAERFSGYTERYAVPREHA